MNGDIADGGGPAFPSDHFGEWGMTLRDYFAAKAMASLLAPCINSAPMEEVALVPAGVSFTAYAVADAMLTARNKE